MNAKRDLKVIDHGSIVLVRPDTKAAREWLEATAPEDALYWCSALVVEPRYVAGVVECAREAGLEVS
jgi:hypothetical protein